MGLFDTWHRNSVVYGRLLHDYQHETARVLDMYRQADDRVKMLEATLDAVRLELRDARQAVAAEKDRFVSDAAQRVELMQECERLRFENESQERLIDTLKQTIYDHEQTITRLTAHDVAPKRTKRPVPSPANIVILEERDTKIKAKPKTKRPVKKARKS